MDNVEWGMRGRPFPFAAWWRSVSGPEMPGTLIKIGAIKMLPVSDVFGKMDSEELSQYISLFIGLQGRLVIDDLKKDQRGPREVLNAKYLAATDVKRAVESLKAYQELVARP
jgi:hypothetical protein